MNRVPRRVFTAEYKAKAIQRARKWKATTNSKWAGIAILGFVSFVVAFRPAESA